MKLVGRIPVEPLDEERLVNIERHIVANAKVGPAEPSPRRHYWFAGALVAAGAAAVLGWKLRGEPAPVAAPVAQHFGITTDPQHATLALDDAGATIASTAGTTFDVTREPGKVIVKMTKGTLDLAVEHREGRLLVVRAGDTDVEDVGTKFSVSWDGVGDVDVRVREGQVRVKHASQDVLVAKGQEWKPSGVIALVEQPAVTEPATVGSAAIVVATKEPPPILHDRHSEAPPAPAPVHRVVRSEEPKPVLGEPATSPAHSAPAVPSDPYIDLKQAIRKQPLAADPRIDGQGDAAAEIARLKKIAYSPTGGDDASQALYRMAVLLYKPLHQDNEALRTLEVYRRRFEHGKELDAVLWLRVRITCGHEIDDACRQAAYSYQQGAPSGDAASVAIRITNAQ